MELEARPTILKFQFENTLQDPAFGLQECWYDTKIFSPDCLAFGIVAVIPGRRLDSHPYVARPVTPLDRTAFQDMRRSLVERQHIWSAMDSLRAGPDAILLPGGYPKDEATQGKLSQLKNQEDDIESHLCSAYQRVVQTSVFRQIQTTPLLLIDAADPHAPKSFVLYKSEVWSCLKGFRGSQWASIIRSQIVPRGSDPIYVNSLINFSIPHVTQDRTAREKIPPTVRDQVWRRDRGQCSRCGSRERLEYDHIIPISKGGSSTARNVELLCESCNRQKGSSVVLF